MTACRAFDDWPKLLLGPMVRRVTADRVSVFIATSVAGSARLGVRRGRVLHGEIDEEDFSPSVALDRIGNRLWVGLLQASLNSVTSPGEVFGYDVQLITTDGTFGLYELGELGTSTNPVPDFVLLDTPLGYEPGMLPSFVVPPADVGSLRLAQASCRKPHGGVEAEPDALAILDEVIALSLGVSDPEPAAGPLPEAPIEENRERPHQLILTGDQIYADDVASGLLAALTEAGEELLGWHEELPGVVANWNEFMVQPGWRSRFLEMQEIVEAPEIGEIDYAANHLLMFGEWCAMYIFAWSDALWARSEGKQGVELPEPGYRLPFTDMVAFAQKLEQIPFVQIIPPAYTRWVDLIVVLDEFDENIAEVWKDTLDQTMRFGASVRKVRRVLANVATYTMFDDHEITDDWFLNKDALDRQMGVDAEGWTAEIGKRLMRNGLSAYAIFQHWGNVPEDFGSVGPGTPRVTTTHGATLLSKWTVSVPPQAQVISPPSLAGAQQPVGAPMDPKTHEADVLLGIDVQPSPVPSPGTAREDFPRMRWDYDIWFDSHHLIALDTRTWRSFPDAAPSPWPDDLEPFELTPEDTATLEYLDIARTGWLDAAATAGSVSAGAFADLLEAAVGAAGAEDAPTTESYLVEVASAVELLIGGEPSLWSQDGIVIARAELETFREYLNPGDTDTSGESPREDQLWQGAVFLRRVARIRTEHGAEPLAHALAAFATLLENAETGSDLALSASVAKVLGAVGTDVYAIFADRTDFESTAALAINEAGLQVAALLESIDFDSWSIEFFRDGTHQLGAALISEEALKFQLTDQIGAEDPDAPPTILISPAPIFGNALVEVAQRAALIEATLKGRAGATEWEYEAWSVNTPALTNLYLAAKALPRCVVLSGDVHYANSSVNDVEMLADGVTTRYVQLTSSSAHNSRSIEKSLGLLDDMLWGPGGEFAMSQVSLSKIGQSTAPNTPNLFGWGVEVAEEWVSETISVKNFGEMLYEQISDMPQSIGDWLWYQVSAPYNSVMAWATEAAYMTWKAAMDVGELREDPLKALFGDYLFAKDVLRQQLIDFYNECGVDPALGPQVRRTMLRDLRYLPDATGKPGLRLDLYRARKRYEKYGPTAHITLYANQQEVQTVGSSNVGLLQFKTDPDGVVLGVRHELLWYPVPEPESGTEPWVPAGLVLGAGLPRVDWMGTVHECSWTAVAHRFDDLAPEAPAVS